MSRHICIGFLTVFAAIALAQSPAPPPAFDIADVHVSAHVINPFMRGGVLRGGRYDVRTANMLELICNAYGLQNEKVQGGPSWLETDYYDISTKAPVNTPPEAVKRMLQSLLAERFQLKVHTDTKPMPAFGLALGKGKPKLKESDGAAESRCRFIPQNKPVVPTAVISCQNRTMEQFAQDLHNFAGDYFNNQPLVDQTELKGSWDFDLKWMPRGVAAAASAAGVEFIGIFDAVDKQLGLKLEAAKLPVPVLVVDSVDRKPSPNPPDVAASLPVLPPPEFEVATIKPSAPDATNTRGQLEHGRINVENMPLKNLIEIAWDLNADELLANAPKFVDSAHFDITAKAAIPERGPEVDFEDLRLMLRALLIERFDLKAHFEERQIDGYVLSAVKPKMQKADPSNRTNCKEGPGPDGKDPRLANPILARLIYCQNMTMALLADRLPNLAGGYVHTTVVDETGLTDSYDFTLSFSPIGSLRTGRPPGMPAPAPAQQPAASGGTQTAVSASDPSGAVSLPEAVNKQLGLKLDLKKRPTQVLVIDHINEKPIEN
jgi:uncharacterized protein (TIGR03435 family)